MEPDNIGLNGRDVSLRCRSLSLTRSSLGRREGARLEDIRFSGSFHIAKNEIGCSQRIHVEVEDLQVVGVLTPVSGQGMYYI